MKYRKVFWGDYSHLDNDDNNGLIFGIEEAQDMPEYVEWFGTEEEREKNIEDNNLELE